MAIICSVNYSGAYGNYYEFKAEASETFPSDYIATNSTKVNVNIYLRRINVSSNGAFNDYGTGWSITIDGTTTTGNSTWSTKNTNAWQYLGSASKTITHNANGSKTITISASHTGNSASGSSKMGNASGSGQLVLTTIPRTSSVSCNSFNIGESTTITISRANDNFTHTLEWYFGEASGTLETKTTKTSVGKTIPAASLYAQIPNATSGTGTIKCYTYSGNTHIGTSECTFTAYAKQDDCIPTVSATIVDTNEDTKRLTGTDTKFIKGFSNAKVTVSATAKNSATITKYLATTGDGKTGNTATYTFNGINDKNITVKATDSRKYEEEKPYTLTWVNYVKLAFTTISVKRTESTANTATMTIKGNYFKGSFGSETNYLQFKYRFKPVGGSFSNWTAPTPSISNNNTFSYTQNLSNLSPDNEYIFEFFIKDQLMTITQTFQLSKGIPALRIGKDYVQIETLRLLGEALLKKSSNSVYYDAKRTDTGTHVRFGVGSGGINHGVFSQTLGKWLLYADDTDVYINGIKDNHGTLNTTDTWIPVYKDNTIEHRVIHKDINNALPVTLYDNSSGTTGTVTLSDSAANYSRIKVFYGCEGIICSTEISSPNGKIASLNVTYCNCDPQVHSDWMYFYVKTCTISGSSITHISSRNNYINAVPEVGTWGSDNYVRIYKVIGYK